MRRFIALILLLAQPALAAPKVAATLPPLAGLVSALMQDVGTPAALMPANAEPHGFSLRPSQISALRDADLVFAVGLDLEPWLARVEGDFTVVYLADTVSEPLPARNFDLSPRQEPDPHLWLDPGMMIPWVLEISQALVQADPAHSATYRSNEFALLKEIVAAKERLEATGMRMNEAGMRLVVSHDAYQYLEHRLEVPMLGMLTDYTEQRAGARSLSKISRLEGDICVIDNPEISMPESILPDAPRVEIDPMGAGLEIGPEFPAQFYLAISTHLEGCFSEN